MSVAIPIRPAESLDVGARSVSSSRVEWILFFLLNAALFLRPEEFIPSLSGASLYQWLILMCAAVCFPRVLEILKWRSLARQPITICVLGITAAITLSHLSNGRIGDGVRDTITFAKVGTYYLLFITLVNTKHRLQQVLIWIVAFTVILTGISIANYHGLLNIPGLRADPDIDAAQIDPQTGMPVTIWRMQSVGIFGNPNDLARILVVALLICLFEASQRPLRFRSLLWLAPLLVLGYGLKLTYSRGGLLALGSGVVALMYARYGWKKTMFAAIAVIPIIVVFFSGRQTELDMSSGTAQQRIHIWSDGLALWHGSPIFGIGMQQFGIILGLVAHNSFVQAYVELGLFGGILFTGAFYLAMSGLNQFVRGRAKISDIQMLRLGSSLIAIIAGYIVGMVSSTRTYSEMTYMLLALVSSYFAIVQAGALLPAMHLSKRMVWRVALVGLVVLAGFSVYIRFAAIYGEPA